MLNKSGKIIILVGLVLIILGCIIFFKGNGEKNVEKEKILVDTTNKTGDIIDKIDYKFFETSSLKSIDMYSRYNDNYKYTFLVPSELNEYYLDDYKKDFKNEHLEIDAYVMKNWNFDDFNEILKSQFGKYFNKFNYSYNDTIKIGNYDAVYIKYEAFSDTLDNSEDRNLSYEEKFAVVVNLSDHYFVLVYRYRYCKTDDNMLTELINGINITEIDSLPSYYKVENDYIVGSIKQNKFNEFEHGYKVSYKLSNEEFKIDEYKNNNVNSTYLINNDQTISISYELYMTYENDAETEITYLIKEKNRNTEVENYQAKEKEYNNKKFAQIEFSYLDKITQKTKYYTGFIEKIEDNYAILTNIDSEKKLNDEELNNYLEYEIKEY